VTWYLRLGMFWLGSPVQNWKQVVMFPVNPGVELM
jgi:hypothetical protein